MTSLHVGAVLKRDTTASLGLVGAWSVWSQAEGPGCYFLIPADGDARASGLKYAVVRAVMGRHAIEAALELLRVDPPPGRTP